MALLGVGAQVGILLPFSRSQETESDVLGLRYMAKAGFDPRAAIELWENMAKSYRTAGNFYGKAKVGFLDKDITRAGGAWRSFA